jgi:hypothetical protein
MAKKRKALFLTIYKQWFNEILDGTKTIEYRQPSQRMTTMLTKDYDIIIFQNGYSMKSPRLFVEYKGYSFNDETGLYEIRLGKVLKTTNVGKRQSNE